LGVVEARRNPHVTTVDGILASRPPPLRLYS
jgi:hypothetical protein